LYIFNTSRLDHWNNKIFLFYQKMLQGRSDPVHQRKQKHPNLSNPQYSTEGRESTFLGGGRLALPILAATPGSTRAIAELDDIR